jgi:hypothetical protein
MPAPKINAEQFEGLLTDLCKSITAECAAKKFDNSKEFETRVRTVLNDLVSKFGLAANFDPHPYVFPDIVLGKFGVEVKFTTNDTWRSVANSVFEGTRKAEIKHAYE